MSSPRPNWDPLPPLPQARVSPRTKGGGVTLACGWGSGGKAQLGRLKKRPSTLSTQCFKDFKLQQSLFRANNFRPVLLINAARQSVQTSPCLCQCLLNKKWRSRYCSFKGTQDWEFFWLRFWNLHYFFVSYVKILRFYKKKFWLAHYWGRYDFSA